MRTLDACPACGGKDSTVVSEYNRFITVTPAPNGGAERYDYSLCHACGLVFARTRPGPDEFRHLLANFDDGLGRPVQTSNPVLSTLPLDEAGRAEIRRRAQAGIFVSEEAKLGKNDWLPTLQKDRLAAAWHLEILLSLVPEERRRRVVEIRSRTGALLNGLERAGATEVLAMPMFDSQKCVIEEVYGIAASSLIDYVDFAIPGEAAFDLIICKHMLTHALDPDALFDELQARLVDGGFVYFYAEPDDSGELERRKNMFVTLNPFHLQTFDRHAFARVLRGRGFDPVYLAHEGNNLLCLARKDPAQSAESMSDKELEARLDYYRRWRDYSVVTLSKRAGRERVIAAFGDELDVIEARAIDEGWAERRKGEVKLAKDAKPKDDPAEARNGRSLVERLTSGFRS